MSPKIVFGMVGSGILYVIFSELKCLDPLLFSKKALRIITEKKLKKYK